MMTMTDQLGKRLPSMKKTVYPIWAQDLRPLADPLWLVLERRLWDSLLGSHWVSLRGSLHSDLALLVQEFQHE